MDTSTAKKKLYEEFEALRRRLVEVEGQLQEGLGDAADTAVRQVRRMIGPEPVDETRREALIRRLAELKSRRRGDGQMISHWLEAEEEVDELLHLLGLRS